MSRLLLLFLLLAPEFKPALPGYQYEFPRDHGSHPEYQLEWWYWTGHLRSHDGREFGYELTFFRSALHNHYENPSRWRVRDLYPAHFALSDLGAGKFHFFEKFNRSGPGIAGARVGSLDVWNENWSARMSEEGEFALSAQAGEIRLELTQTSEKPPVVHGRGGVSQKAEGEGRASHYYSMTRLLTSGTLTYGGRRLQVNGESWMDHEFGTNQLAPDQIGWDWFSVQLENGEELMIYGIRRKDGSLDPYSAGTAATVDGRSVHLKREEFTLEPRRWWTSPKSGGRYPVAWTIRIPSLDVELRADARMDDQELVTNRSTNLAYWEGAVSVKGRWKGAPAKGRGYLEMTGYAPDSRPDI